MCNKGPAASIKVYEFLTVYDSDGELIFKKQLPDDLRNQAIPFKKELCEAIKDPELKDMAITEVDQYFDFSRK